MRTSLFILGLCSLLPALATAADNNAVRDLHALFDAEWERALQENPLAATYLGDPRYNGFWPDASLGAIERSHGLDLKALEALQRIPRAALPPDEQLNYDLFEHAGREQLAAYEFKPYLYVVGLNNGVQTASETAELLNFDSVKAYEDWLSRLNKLGTYVDQNIALLTQGTREHRTPPRIIMQRVPGQIAKQLVAQPEDSPFFGPFKNFPDAVSAADRERLTAAARKAITEVVIPAYRRFSDFFTQHYLPACRETVGLWDTPNGDAFYQQRVRFHTTTSMTPEAIHQLGLKEVARIRGEMDKVIAQTGFKGSFQDFQTFLRTDPQFYYKTGDELFEAYAALAKKIDPELVKLFGKLPRTPYGVRPIPMTSAPDTTTAYYQPAALDGSRAGYYYVNLYRPEVRPKWEMEVLTVHEAVPGHHLQLSLAAEQKNLPKFRRTAGYTVYVEGWGLYSESLGSELGLYKDPYSKFGQLTYEMWRAVRLVVDTGMHYKHWTREQAIDYFKANAAKTEADIVNEIDRYIGDPGQALAYKIGQLRIRALRAEAEQKLGKRFDVREFHDTLLSTGAVPIDIMERNMRDWIARKLAAG